MKLSIIVVSFNVKGHLGLCLDAALKAMDEMGSVQSELIVLDNASSDGTVDWVASNYPRVKLISSQENLGFSKGNNRAYQESSGEWVLLLNPDTVVAEDTFALVLSHAEANPKIGAIGVPMYDGSGRWLPESKRGMPTPWASFCRLSGLWRLAPRSNVFNRYYWGAVDEDSTAEVEVLSGAFMWMRRKALDEVGMLDEAFFMYGEDIDLSIRIKERGWVNHYLSEAPIIHFKGESTKKGSLSYVRVFHDAMRIFSEKHFAGGQALAMRVMIRLGIQVRAVSAFINGWASRQWLTLMDMGVAALMGTLVVMGHAKVSGIDHPALPVSILVGVGALSAMFANRWFGSHDHPLVRTRTLMAGCAAGVVAIVLYSLLPEQFRVSRIAAGLLSLSLTFLPLIMRWALVAVAPKRWRWRRPGASVGLLTTPERAEELLNWVESSYGSSLEINMIGIDTSCDLEDDILQNEMVLCDAEIGGRQVISWVRKAGRLGLDLRVVPSNMLLALGGRKSGSAPGVQLPWGADGLGRIERARAKRRVDVLWSLWILLVGSGRGSRSNAFSRANARDVLARRKTWLGFHSGWDGDERLPNMKPGIFFVGKGDRAASSEEAKRLDLRYAFDFGWIRDVELLMTLRMD